MEIMLFAFENVTSYRNYLRICAFHNILQWENTVVQLNPDQLDQRFTAPANIDHYLPYTYIWKQFYFIKLFILN